MKYIIIFILITFITPSTSQDDIHHKLFSPDELREDLNFLIDNFEKIHPDIYSYTSKKNIDLMKKNVMGVLNKPMTRQEFALKVIPLVSFLKMAIQTSFCQVNKESNT